MHIVLQKPDVFCPYPSPPDTTESDDYFAARPPQNSSEMGANTQPSVMTNVDGVGLLTYQRAIDIARNTEGELDPNVAAYLEGALIQIWQRIQQRPDVYVMSRDEFAVFNYYRARTEGNPIAEQAVARYWSNAGRDPGTDS